MAISAIINDGDILEMGTAPWKGGDVRYMWVAREILGKKFRPVLYVYGENAAGNMEWMEAMGPYWHDDEKGTWFMEGGEPMAIGINISAVDSIDLAEPTNRTVSELWVAAEFQEEAMLPDGRRCFKIYHFNAAEVADAERDSEDAPEEWADWLPWDDAHVAYLMVDGKKYANVGCDMDGRFWAVPTGDR